MPKLHLGCFNHPVDGWTNVDITPHIWIARVPGLPLVLRRLGYLSVERYDDHCRGVFRKVHYLNVAKRFPYPDNSFEAVFSSHMLEHLTPKAARNCVAESFRVLRRGGVCRIAVPDLDEWISKYDPNDGDTFASWIFGGWSGLQKNSHHWIYNQNSLRNLLLSVGFTSTVRTSYRVGVCPNLDLLDNRPPSLFMEAIK